MTPHSDLNAQGGSLLCWSRCGQGACLPANKTGLSSETVCKQAPTKRFLLLVTVPLQRALRHASYVYQMCVASVSVAEMLTPLSLGFQRCAFTAFQTNLQEDQMCLSGDTPAALPGTEAGAQNCSTSCDTEFQCNVRASQRGITRVVSSLCMLRVSSGIGKGYSYPQATT